MHLTHHAHFHTAYADSGAAAGVVAGVGLQGGVAGLLQPQTGKDGFQLALQMEEAHAVAVGTQHQHLGFLRQHLAFHRQVDLCQLVQHHIPVVVGIVPAQDLQHGGQDDGAHDGGILAQRVLDPQSLAQGRIGTQADLVKGSGRDEGVGDDLIIAQTPAQLTGLGFQLHFLAVAALSGGLESGGGDLVVAVGAAHFLGNVCHPDQVGTEGGNQNGVALHGDLQPVQVADHVLLGDIRAQQAVDLVSLQRQGALLGDVVDDINGAAQHIASIQHFHQLTGPLNGGDGQHGIQALFKLAGSLGTHTQSQSALTDGGSVEVGGFKDHHGGVVLNFGVLAAHDTGKADGSVFVGNDQHTGLQTADGAVQGGQGFALLSFPDDDLLVGDVAVVKGVHGLAVLQHNIVGDIHNVVDGTNAVGTQALPQPLGGGADLHIGHHPGGVAVAQIFRRNLHIQIVIDVPGIAAMNHRLVVAHGLMEGSGGLSGQTDDGVAVGTVVGDLKVHHGVIVANDLVDVLTYMAVLVIQDPDAVSVGTGKIVLGQTQLGKGAEHTVGRNTPELALGDVDAAGQVGVVQSGGNQIPFMDILCAGDDLNRGFLSHIYLADPHVVGVFVADDGNHLANHNILDLGIHPLIGFYFLTKDGELFHKFLVRDLGQIHKFFIQPFPVEFHTAILLRTGSGTARRCQKSDAGR